MGERKDNMFSSFDREQRRRNGGGIGGAVILILVGVAFLCYNSGIIEDRFRPLLFSWQMIFVLLGIVKFTKKQILEGCIWVLVGLVLLFPAISRAFPAVFGDFNIDFRLYWPVILILVGVVLLLKKVLFKRTISFANNDENIEALSAMKSSGKTVSKNVIFSSSEHIVFSQEFEGGELNAVFGEIILDLRKIEDIDINNKLEANVVFASIIIIVPDTWDVDIKGDSVFGSIVDKRPFVQKNENINNNILRLKAAAVFGSIEIRN